MKLVTPHIVKQNTCMKRAISPHERLTTTLRFLATGRNYKDLEFTTTISKQALSEIVPETCKACNTDEGLPYLKQYLLIKKYAMKLQNKK